LNRLVDEWTRDQEAFSLMQRLQAQGVPAGIALTNRDALFSEHLNAREFFRVIKHDETSGLPPIPYAGIPWRLPESPPLPARPGASLGEHNRQVIVDLLGWPERELETLEAEGAIGWLPVDYSRPNPVALDVLLNQGRIATYDPEFRERIARAFGS
jgi:crotonobetainyl-CoA:carnitine CoA-transferase CaiB-like acyl-CoA transferase